MRTVQQENIQNKQKWQFQGNGVQPHNIKMESSA